MPTGHVYIATSIDGFIARLDGGLDWLESANSAGEDHGYQAFMDRIDGIVMGRATFDVVLRFDPWPYDRPLLVLSRKLDSADIPSHVADWVTIVQSVSDALAEGQRRGWDRVYVDGGATIQAFLDAGAISDMVITRIPVLLGTGLPLFGPLSDDLPLRHVETRSFPSGLVQSRYEVPR
ncbi:MAG: dihydrofolate reductase family protein [Burkholderiaceae bacterium]|nr:dihydrofolate reductase family protein [Burkholderiaceae bacterium]